MTTTTIQAGYKQTEIGVIPEDWEVKALAEITVSVASGTSNTKNENGGDFPLYGSTGIIGHRKKYDYSGKKILVARVGANAGSVNQVEGSYCVSDNTLIVSYQKGFDMDFQYYQLIAYNLNKLVFGSGQPLVTGGQLKSLVFPFPPTTTEQQAIATVLSDTDELIRSLSALIAKKRQIKEGAMQELLTGKKRLTGFSGEWEVKKLGEVANFYDNLRVPITESKRESGITPYYGANGIQGYIKGHTHNGEFVLIAEDGANDLNNYPVLYVNGKIWVNNHAHVIQGKKECINNKYLSYALKNVNFVQVLVGGTRAKLNGSVAKLIQLVIPNDITEQQAIAEILSDMDSEITALEQKREKYRLIKQGMMQQLLTGKIRLVTK